MLSAPGAAPHEEVVCDHDEARRLALKGTALPANQRVALRPEAQELDVAPGEVVSPDADVPDVPGVSEPVPEPALPAG